MISIKLICVGKLKEKYLVQAEAEYLKRLSGFCNAGVTEIAEEPCANESEASRKLVMEAEGQRILAKIPKGAKTIALCIEGSAPDSAGFSRYIFEQAANGAGCFAFIIGGSYGLAEKVKASADLCLSFSKMTFPHQLMRVVLLEQIYRAFHINGNGKYHK